MKGSFETWEDFRKTLNITPEEEAVIQLEKELIEATIKAREEAKISRIEKMKVSPSVDTLNHLLFQLGYRLKVVPLSKK